MSKRTLAILAAIGATTIYGLNHTIAKGVMPFYVEPYGFIFLRVLGAAVLFWLLSFFVPKEKIVKKDWGRLAVCATLGACVNMLAFFKGLSLSTPINSSVLVTTTPIMVIVLSALLIKEKITLQKATGILIGFIGAVTLIVFGAEVRQDAPNIPLGNLLFIVNSICYGTYLILIKKMIEKYHPFTVLKWLFTLGVLLTFPVAYAQVEAIMWSKIPIDIVGSILFVVVGTTFLTYLFNVFALTQLKASTVSAFVYLQPLIGILFAVFTGKDSLTTLKIVATILVLTGIYLASKRPKPSL
ncbi:DMT family transporter [Arenibacter sp. GZD96]|uniref:DMT family transporter n=1 Tax=Aurantibrevibacter litoralis TaxID=3106030 RepID=UPI002AFE547D|nr:DMT family transporter [Arenibacter sp. GZD-96]MEA1785620.1 DMT family transporter [Arenibacter sp. GZD-96]